MGKTKILIVDDESKLVRLVREVLTAAGYEVLATCSGEHAIEMVALEAPDLVILDIILSYGDLDGYEVAKRLRSFSDIPIIMLTAKVREPDMLRGFEVGADDYITKPFSSKELLARVRAVLKRMKQESAPGETEIVCGELKVNLASRRVTIGDREVHLTTTEYNLLHELAMHRDQVLLHDQLLTAVWGSEYRDDIDYLRSYIRYLRQKIEPVPTDPRWIRTVPGVGYMLVSQKN